MITFLKYPLSVGAGCFILIVAVATACTDSNSQNVKTITPRKTVALSKEMMLMYKSLPAASITLGEWPSFLTANCS
jgi:hypothetical protein